MGKINKVYSWRNINSEEKHLADAISSKPFYIKDKELYKKVCERIGGILEEDYIYGKKLII